MAEIYSLAHYFHLFDSNFLNRLFGTPPPRLYSRVLWSIYDQTFGYVVKNDQDICKQQKRGLI